MSKAVFVLLGAMTFLAIGCVSEEAPPTDEEPTPAEVATPKKVDAPPASPSVARPATEPTLKPLHRGGGLFGG